MRNRSNLKIVEAPRYSSVGPFGDDSPEDEPMGPLGLLAWAVIIFSVCYFAQGVLEYFGVFVLRR